jgi:hypothetical protein
MSKGPPRAGRPWDAYCKFLEWYAQADDFPVADVQSNTAWPGFFNWFRKHGALLKHFQAGAAHYKAQGWQLPSFVACFQSKAGYPILNVLRHGAKKEKPRVQVTRPTAARIEEIRRKYDEEDPAIGRGGGARGPGSDDAR